MDTTHITPTIKTLRTGVLSFLGGYVAMAVVAVFMASQHLREQTLSAPLSPTGVLALGFAALCALPAVVAVWQSIRFERLLATAEAAPKDPEGNTRPLEERMATALRERAFVALVLTDLPGIGAVVVYLLKGPVLLSAVLYVSGVLALFVLWTQIPAKVRAVLANRE